MGGDLRVERTDSRASGRQRGPQGLISRGRGTVEVGDIQWLQELIQRRLAAQRATLGHAEKQLCSRDAEHPQTSGLVPPRCRQHLGGPVLDRMDAEVALKQLRFASFAVIKLREDLHLQECGHAGRT